MHEHSHKWKCQICDSVDENEISSASPNYRYEF